MGVRAGDPRDRTRVEAIATNPAYFAHSIFKYCSFYIQVDPFHTLFGIAGLSLLGNRDIKPVNPVLCMPEAVLDRIGLKLKLIT